MTEAERQKIREQVKAVREGRELAGKLTNWVNTYGESQEIKSLIEGLLCQHRTLQQSFFNQFVLKLIETIANWDENQTDARNKEMKKICDIIFNALEDNTKAYIDTDGKKKVYCLPFI